MLCPPIPRSPKASNPSSHHACPQDGLPFRGRRTVSGAQCVRAPAKLVPVSAMSAQVGRRTKVRAGSTSRFGIDTSRLGSKLGNRLKVRKAPQITKTRATLKTRAAARLNRANLKNRRVNTTKTNRSANTKSPCRSHACVRTRSTNASATR